MKLKETVRAKSRWTISRFMSDGSGFTLIELMIAVSLVAIVAMAATASVNTLVSDSDINRATDTLAGDLQQARLKAIKTARPVTVDFNVPNANQYTITWTDANNVMQTKVVDLNRRNPSVVFDNAPPGGPQAPDARFTFGITGFIQPSGGGNIGNIYLVDADTVKFLRISTTIAGAIEQRRWNGAAWSGPQLACNFDCPP